MICCGKCNTLLDENSNFCYKCGTKVIKTIINNESQQVVSESKEAPVERVAAEKLNISFYEGVPQAFPFMGDNLFVDASIDSYNFYRKAYRKAANEQANELKQEYFLKVQNLDAFLKDFVPLYLKHRERLIENAIDILFQAGIYDVSVQAFGDQHTKDFCLCAEDVNIMIESFNKTIEANQERKIRNYNMLPGFMFGGLGGLIAATATNLVVNSIAEADIKNANVTVAQREELFRRINTHVLIERAFLDYWRVFQSLTWRMANRGLHVWYPSVEFNERADGLFQNLCNGRIPKEQEISSIILMIQLNPYNEEYFKYIVRRFGKTEEINDICTYFGYDINLFE